MEITSWVIVGVIIATAIVARLEQHFEGQKQRKAQVYTLLTMMNHLTELSGKCGYASWIEYLKETYGQDNTSLFLMQIYQILYRSRVKGGQIDEIKDLLQKYLKHNPPANTDGEAGKFPSGTYMMQGSGLKRKK